MDTLHRQAAAAGRALAVWAARAVPLHDERCLAAIDGEWARLRREARERTSDSGARGAYASWLRGRLAGSVRPLTGSPVFVWGVGVRADSITSFRDPRLEARAAFAAQLLEETAHALRSGTPMSIVTASHARVLSYDATPSRDLPPDTDRRVFAMLAALARAHVSLLALGSLTGATDPATREHAAQHANRLWGDWCAAHAVYRDGIAPRHGTDSTLAAALAKGKTAAQQVAFARNELALAPCGLPAALRARARYLPPGNARTRAERDAVHAQREGLAADVGADVVHRLFEPPAGECQ
jgi:hypothetical protein